MRSLSEESVEMLVVYFENEIRSYRGLGDFNLENSLVAKELRRRSTDEIVLMIRQRHEIIFKRKLFESDLVVRDGFAALLVVMLAPVQ
jgi:hypothetical protein